MNVLNPRSCYNAAGQHKRTFEDRKTAKAHAPKFVEVYQCSNCSLYHFSAKRKRWKAEQ